MTNHQNGTTLLDLWIGNLEPKWSQSVVAVVAVVALVAAAAVAAAAAVVVVWDTVR